MSIKLNNGVTTNTSWSSADDILNDWTVFDSGYRMLPEGFGMWTGTKTVNKQSVTTEQAAISNKITVTEDTAKMQVNVRRFNQNDDRLVGYVLAVDGTPIAPMGYDSGILTIEDVSPVTHFVYDLSAYVGKTIEVMIVTQSVDTESPDDTLVITSITLSKWEATTPSTLTYWEKGEIKSDWNTTYASEYRDGTGEGFDLNTNDGDGNEFIYNDINVTETTSVLTIKVRRFNFDNGKANAIIVSANGTALVAKNYSNARVTIEDTDGDVTTLTYDLSAYVGKTVRIVIMQPVPKTGHLVVMSVKLSDGVTANTTWSSAKDVFEDWSISDAGYRMLNEGFGLWTGTKTENGQEITTETATITNKMLITEDTAKMVVSVRRYGQNSGRLVGYTLTVNGTAIAPVNYESSTVEVKDVESVTPFTYDLSSFIGQVVEIKISSQSLAENDKDDTLVITSIKLSKFVTTNTSWSSAEDIYDEWAINDAGYRMLGEGFGMWTGSKTENDQKITTEQAIISNKITITEDTTKLDVNVRRFNQNNNRLVGYALMVDGTLLTPMGYDSNMLTIEDVEPVTHFVYDLSAYVGKTVEVKIITESIDEENPDDTLVITSIALSKWETTITPSTFTSWDKSNISTDWNTTYASENRDVVEGFDFNTYDNDGNEFIYNDITVTESTKIFTIKVRRFGCDGDKANAIIISANGTALVAKNYSNARVTIEDTDGDITTLTYDLSAYVGQTVRIVIMQPVPKTGHLVITNIYLNDGVTTNTSWTSAKDVIGDWTISDAGYRMLNEGFGLWTGTKPENGQQITTEQAVISNRILITEDTTKMVVNVRRFGQNSGRLVAYAVEVNGTRITPEGYENSALPIKDVGLVTQFVYDLSSFVGQVVEVKIGSQSLAESDKDDTLVITSIKLSKFVTTNTSWSSADDIFNDWTVIDDGYRMLNEGFGLWTGSKTENDQKITTETATISNKITVTEDTTKLVVNVRRYGQNSGRLVGYTLFVNDTAITPYGYNSSTLQIKDVESITQFTYDLSSYVGQVVVIKITSQSLAENDKDDTLVITSIKLSKIVTTKTSWTSADEVFDDWTVNDDGYRMLGEGFGLWTGTKTENDQEITTEQAIISNKITITEDTTKLVVSVRRFNQNNGRLVAYALAVNGTLITPVGYESSALPIQDTEDVTTFVYDLSSYVGQTIEVKMGSQSLAESGKDDTLVITEISLSKLAEAE